MSPFYIRDGRAPIPEKESTSRVMSANKGKSTKPELLLRKYLYNNGYRGYRINYKQLPGRPDIVFTKQKLAIFVNGCYWHRCKKCNLPFPKSNVEFWKKKFKNNIERDENNISQLIILNWKVVVVWECEIKDNIGDCLATIIKEMVK